MVTTPVPARSRPTRFPGPGARRAGYVVAIAVNLTLLVIVNNLLEWEWLPFLTDEFSRLIPLIDISLGAGIVVNSAFIAYDAQWFRSFCQIGLNLISLVLAIRTWQVFPFDFSGAGFDWNWVARLVLVLTIVGTVIGSLTEAARLVRGMLAPPPPPR